jgi:hypothetical protein
MINHNTENKIVPLFDRNYSPEVCADELASSAKALCAIWGHPTHEHEALQQYITSSTDLLLYSLGWLLKQVMSESNFELMGKICYVVYATRNIPPESVDLITLAASYKSIAEALQLRRAN